VETKGEEHMKKVLAAFLALTFFFWIIPYIVLRNSYFGFVELYKDILWKMENKEKNSE